MLKNKYKMRAKVWLYPGMAGWHFVTLTKNQSGVIKETFGEMSRGWGSLPVVVTIGKTSWKTSIFPDKKAGAYLLPLRADVRKPVAQAPIVETAILAAVGTYKGSGTATRSFDGTTFNHTVTVTIGDSANGKFYEGWLVMKTVGDPKFFSTGKLIKQGAVYTLTYTTAQNYPDHKDVVITEETLSRGLDGKPEAHVLEGSFK